jgi:hypothetical protein
VSKALPPWIKETLGLMEFQEEIACHSCVGKDIQLDYSLAFSDCQRLHELRRKLHRAQQVLRSNILIVEGCQARWAKLVPQYFISFSDSMALSFESHRLELRGHDKVIEEMLKFSEGTMHLV